MYKHDDYDDENANFKSNEKKHQFSLRNGSTRFDSQRSMEINKTPKPTKTTAVDPRDLTATVKYIFSSKTNQ